MKLRQVIPVGFASIIVVMIANGVISQLTVMGLTSTVDDVMDSYSIQKSLQSLEQVLVDIQLGERGFIITQKDEFLDPYNKAQASLKQEFEKAKLLVKNNPEQTQRLVELQKIAEQGIEVLSTNISKVRRGYKPSPNELLEGKQSLEIMRAKIDEMLKAEDKVLAQKQQLVDQSEVLSTISSLGGTLIGALLSLFIIFFVIRKVIKPIKEVTLAITGSSTEIAATVEQHEKVAAQQATAANQTTATMNELGVSSRCSAEQAESAVMSAQKALALAGGSAQNSMSLIKDSSLKEKVGKIAEQILQLSEQTSQIGYISTLVSDLANQTNMLALNAAVEAVRAGDQGKGFGVVAAEIRKLADQSRKSAEQINSLVTDIQNATNSTIMVTDEGTKTVESIITAISDINVSSQQISLTAKEQSIAIQQVVSAMNSLNQGAVQTVSGISQTKVSTHQLNESAQKLKAVV